MLALLLLMTVSAANVDYQVRFGPPGATEVTDGNVVLTLAVADMSAVPVLSGPSVDVLACRTTSHPFRLSCIVDTVLFPSSGRLTELGRLAQIRTNTDGAGWVEVGTGRVSHASEPNGKGEVVLEISDERWVERRSTVFRVTETVQLHPPGLASAWRDRPAAGETIYFVESVDGTDYLRIRPGDEESGGLRKVPPSLRDALATDLLPTGQINRDSGNFVSLRFRWAGADREVISFGLNRSASISAGLSPGGVLGTLSPDGTGHLDHAWLYIPGHGQSPGAQLTGRFYWPDGVQTSEYVPYHVGGVVGVHAGAFLRAMYDGDFGDQAMRYDEDSMAAIEALPIPAMWLNYRGTGADRAKWLEKNYYPGLGVLPLVGTDLLLRPTSLRIPQNVDPDSLTVLDASNSKVPRWEHGARDLATVIKWTSKRTRYAGGEQDARDTRWPADDLELVDLPIGDIPHDNVATLGEVVHEINSDIIWDLAIGPAFSLSRDIFNVAGDGAQLGTVAVADDAGVQVGQLVVIDQESHALYNASTAARTGTRVVLLLSFRGVSAAENEFDYLDMGPAAEPLAAPTVAITQDGTDPDLVNVAISDVPAGATATVQVGSGSSEPAIYEQIQAGVGNETVTFRLGAASGNAYARAWSVQSHRIPSAFATDSVALSTRARIRTADLYKSLSHGFGSWEGHSTVGGVRTRYAIHAIGTEPSFGNQTDFEGPDGSITIPGVGLRLQVSLEITPYTGWTGSAVTGSAGDTIIVTAIQPRTTGFRWNDRSVGLGQVVPRLTTAGALSALVLTESGARAVRVSAAAGSDPSRSTIEGETEVVVGIDGVADVTDLGGFLAADDIRIGVIVYQTEDASDGGSETFYLRTSGTAIRSGNTDSVDNASANQVARLAQGETVDGGASGFNAGEEADITFASSYDSAPLLILLGFKLKTYEADDSAVDQSLLVQFVDVTTDGATIRAALRSGTTTTPDGDDFPAGNSLDAVAETTECDLASLPAGGAEGDAYSITYSFALQITESIGGSYQVSVTLAFDSNDGGGWVERATRTFNLTAENGATESTSLGQVTQNINVSGLSTNDDIRIRVKSVNETGFGTINDLDVHGFNDGTDGDGVEGVTWLENTGGSSDPAAPDVTHFVTYQALEVAG